jgi:CRP/FNR family cyclic AMP-dependent transcriptional regulator
MPRKRAASATSSAAGLMQRFEGADGRRLLLEALRDQKMVSGNNDLAADLAAQGELIPVIAGTTVIEQDAEDNHVFLILLGAFRIVVNGKLVNKRYSSDHIGEMAAIQPSQRRSASVTAIEDSVLLKISEPQLAELGKKYPEIYRLLAKELAKRLLQRNAMLTRNAKKFIYL